jgi:hypothetical protein
MSVRSLDSLRLKKIRMKPDDFENKLQRQLLRQIPAEWRDGILSAACGVEKKSFTEESIPLWRLIFARFPVASSAFAGFWIVLIAINVFLFGRSGGSRASSSIARSDEPSSIWRLQSAEIQQLASDDQSIASEHPHPATHTAPQSPRSEFRQEDEGIGEIIVGDATNFVA